MGKSSKRTLDQATASDAAAPAAMEVDSAAPPAVASPTKKSKKDKKDKSGAASAAEGDDKEVGLEQLAEIAKPLAVKKTGKHVLRLVKKVHGYKVYACLDKPAGSDEVVTSPPFSAPRLTFCTAPSKPASKSRHLKRGVKEVVKSIRKGEKGIVVLAADISPLDILTHIPLLAEEANCPYIWVTSKESLGLASSTKRPTSCVMVAEKGMKRKAAKDGEAAKDDSKAKETEKEFQEEYAGVKKEVESMEVAIPTY
ncbi:snoRNA-binding protein [Rhodotorula mucilaginosa]|uniref:SnoRNA-binding protein n=1 Tax=Rhodotorula mucilaginosa TaxID=5537 RepID=A0A9P6W021_RHOMI|nr:snoRNA-binding protein [Rhodotorula mucilaginosa]